MIIRPGSLLNLDGAHYLGAEINGRYVRGNFTGGVGGVGEVDPCHKCTVKC